MALSIQQQNIILNFLLNILPHFVNEADELFTKLSTASKSYFLEKDGLSILSNKKFQYYKLYLEPNKIYEDFDKYISNEWAKDFEVEIEKQISKTDPKINPSVALAECIKTIDDITDDALLTPNWHLDSDFDESNIYLINVIIARFFDSLSLIENKKSISTLLSEALLENKFLNISKAVSIDPNVRYIPEICELISKQSINKQASISNQISNALEKSFLTGDKNIQSKLALFYISVVDSMGFIDGSLPLPFKVHKYFAEKSGALKYTDDDNYFYKLFRMHKKNKKSITKL